MAAETVSMLARLQSDQVAARKALAKDHVMLLGMVISDVKNREIELKRDANDDDVVDVIRKAIKKRRESVDMYDKAGRTDLAEKEQREVTMLDAYLPADVAPEVIRAAVRAAMDAGAANIGAVMGKVMPQFKGRADGNLINTIVREEIAKG